MMVDKVFYSDGDEIAVTDSLFKVKKKSYRLLGITGHELKTIKPIRKPGIIITLVGILIASLSNVTYLSSRVPEIELANRQFGGTPVLVAIGFLLGVAGLLVAFLGKPHYAVHISTAEGDNDVIVSSRYEYISEIVNALNRAVMSLSLKPKK